MNTKSIPMHLLDYLPWYFAFVYIYPYFVTKNDVWGFPLTDEGYKVPISFLLDLGMNVLILSVLIAPLVPIFLITFGLGYVVRTFLQSTSYYKRLKNE